MLIMATFPDLIKKSFADCSRAGKPLGIAVLITGGVTILLTVFMWGATLETVGRAIGGILGPDEGERIVVQMRDAGLSSARVQRLAMEVSQALGDKLGSMAEAELSAAIQQMTGTLLAESLPILAGFVVLLLVISLWSRAFFLILGVRGERKFGEIAMDAMAWMLPLLCVCFIIIAAIAAWIAISLLAGVILGVALSNAAGALIAVPLGIAGLIYMWPRLIMAPVALVQDRAGIIGSIRSSIRMTRGHWLKIFGNLVGAWAVVWIVMTACGFIVTVLAAAAGPFPPAPFAINSVMSFVTAAGAAYWTVFLVRLKQAVASSPK